MEDFTNFIRGSTRPVITFMLVFACVWVAIEHGAVDQWLTTTTALVLGYWFGERKTNKK